jgi:hypothetical protein
MANYKPSLNEPKVKLTVEGDVLTMEVELWLKYSVCAVIPHVPDWLTPFVGTGHGR